MRPGPNLFGLDPRALGCCGNAAQHDGELCKPSHWTPFRAHFEYAVVYAEETGSACQTIESSWPAAFALVRDAWRGNGRVLFHCMAGVNRSVTTAAVFMALHGLEGGTWTGALARIHARRAAVNVDDMRPGPRPHWVAQHALPFLRDNYERPAYRAWRDADL